MVERFNKTLVNMVAVLIDPKRRKRDWDKFLPYATFAYRCTPQDSTGEFPNMMMLGREVSLPIDTSTDKLTPAQINCEQICRKLMTEPDIVWARVPVGRREIMAGKIKKRAYENSCVYIIQPRENIMPPSCS